MNDPEAIQITLSREEAIEIFSRCLRCVDEDNYVSASALKKLATVLAKSSTLSAAA